MFQEQLQLFINCSCFWWCLWWFSSKFSTESYKCNLQFSSSFLKTSLISAKNTKDVLIVLKIWLWNFYVFIGSVTTVIRKSQLQWICRLSLWNDVVFRVRWNWRKRIVSWCGLERLFSLRTPVRKHCCRMLWAILSHLFDTVVFDCFIWDP